MPTLSYSTVAYKTYKFSIGSRLILKNNCGNDKVVGVEYAHRFPVCRMRQLAQHVADWVAPFPLSKHSHPPPLKVFHTLPSPPSSTSPITYTGVRGNHQHHYYPTTLKVSIRNRLTASSYAFLFLATVQYNGNRKSS